MASRGVDKQKSIIALTKYPRNNLIKIVKFMGNNGDNYLKGKMSIKIRKTRTTPPQQPFIHTIWAHKAIITIQNRHSLRKKEIDLFNLRLLYVNDNQLKPTIVHILRHLECDLSLNLLAKSILVELGEKIEDPCLIDPTGIHGRKLAHLVRLLILSGKKEDAKKILDGRETRVASEIRIMILRSDPNPQVKQSVPSLT